MSSERPKDPIVEKLQRAKVEQKADADAAAGERSLVKDFQEQANKQGPAEVAKIEAVFVRRCETINADRNQDDPEFTYDAATHELRADRFSTYLELTEGYSPYRLDMVSGSPRNAAQMFAEGFEPEYERHNWKLLARMDESGFYWEFEGEKLTSEEVAELGLDALAGNVAR